MNRLAFSFAIVTALAAGWSGMLAAPAMAVTVVANKCVSVLHANGCTFDGNDTNVAAVAAAYNAAGKPGAPIALTALAKFEFDEDHPQGGTFEFGAGTVTGTAFKDNEWTAGTWALPGQQVGFIAVKASTQFTLFQYAPTIDAGFWSNVAIFKNNKPAGMSHITFYGSEGGPGSGGEPVPEPASWAMLIAGLGLTGASLRRRRPRAA